MLRSDICGISHRKHHRPDNRKREHSHSKSECDDTHPALLELSGRAGEEKHCGKQNSVREVLTGNVAGATSFLQAVCSFCARLSGLARSPHVVEFGHKRMWIGVWILKRSFGQPCVVSLARIGRKALDVEVRELFVARLLRREHLHEHCSVNRRLLYSLGAQQTSPALQRVKFIHESITLSSPSRG